MISVSSENSKAQRLNNCASDLRALKNDLTTYRNNLSQGWQGQEMASIGSALDSLISQIGQQADNADAIASDIRTAASQIRSEEEAEERRRQAAAALLP